MTSCWWRIKCVFLLFYLFIFLKQYEELLHEELLHFIFNRIYLVFFAYNMMYLRFENVTFRQIVPGYTGQLSNIL